MAKLTRRSYKRKKVAFAAVILGGVALVSSGFAAWVLSSNESWGNSGSVTVGPVVNGTLDMKVYCAENTSSLGTAIEKDTTLPEDYVFSFDCDENDKKGTQDGNEDYSGTTEKVYWGLKDKEKPERLSNKFIIVVSSKTDSLASFSAKLSISDDSKKEGFKKAFDAKFITFPDCYSDTGVTVSASEKGDWNNPTGLTNDKCTVKKDPIEDGGFTWTFEYTVSFAWGNRFNKVNPCYFFDSNMTSFSSSKPRTASDDTGIGDGYGSSTIGHDVDNKVIEDDMNWLSEKINQSTYKIEFTATGK